MAGDKKKILDGDSFDYRETKDGKIMLFHNSRHIETLTGKEAEKFSKRMGGADHRAAQLLMAKATKNFKRGNESMGKRK